MDDSLPPEPRIRLPLRVWIPLVALLCVFSLSALVARDVLTGMETALRTQQAQRLRDLVAMQIDVLERRLDEARHQLETFASGRVAREIAEAVTAHAEGSGTSSGSATGAGEGAIRPELERQLRHLVLGLHLDAVDIIDGNGRPLPASVRWNVRPTPEQLELARTLIARSTDSLRMGMSSEGGDRTVVATIPLAAIGAGTRSGPPAPTNVAPDLGAGTPASSQARGGQPPQRLYLVAVLGHPTLDLSPWGADVGLHYADEALDDPTDGFQASGSLVFAGMTISVAANAPATFVTGPVEAIREDVLRNGGLSALVIVAVILAAGYLSSRRAVQLVHAVRRMANGELEDLALPLRQRDEVGDIARALARLAYRLRDARTTTDAALVRSAALDAGSAALAIADAEGTVMYVSPAARRLLSNFPPLRGFIEEGRRLEIADHPDLLRRAGPSTEDVLTAEGRLELRASPVIDDGMLRRGTVIEFVDVTEARRLAATVGAIDSAMPMFEFGAGGDAVPKNELAREMLARLATHETLTEAVDPIIARAPEARHSVARLSLVDGQGIPIRLIGSFAPLHGADGRAYRVLGLFADVTAQTLAAERAESERDGLQAEQAEVVDRLRAALASLAQGDLSQPLQPLAGARHADLHLDFEHARATLRDALFTIRAKADAIRVAVGDVAEEGRDLARRTAHQTDDLEGSAATLERLARDLRNVALLAERTDGSVERARAAARRTREVVARTATAMDQISGSSTRITSVVGVLEEIALQTDLLALNAGVAAARAGPAGRGFAAVADEIRALARRAAAAAGEIGDVVGDASAHVAGGVDAVAEAGAALTEVGGQVESIASAMASFVETARGQSAAVGALSDTMSSLDRATRVTTGLLEDGVAESTALADEAAALLAEVDRFALSEAAPARATAA